MECEKYKIEFTKHLDSLEIFPFDIIKLLSEYWNPTQLEGVWYQQFLLPRGDDEPHPYHITSDHKDFLYVTDWYNHCICIYNLQGRFLGHKIPLPKTTTPTTTISRDSLWGSERDFLYPRGLEFYENQIYLLEKKNLRVLDRTKWTTIKQWSLPDPGDFKDEIGGGTYLCIDPILKNMFVTLQNSHRIFNYSLDGNVLKTFGLLMNTRDGIANCPGSFDKPKGVACDNKFLYVADYGNHQIQILDKLTGTFDRVFGLRGNRNGFFLYPQSIFLYDDIIYVGDSFHIQFFFKNNGEFIQRLGTNESSGSGKGDFNDCTGICIIKGILYSTDFWNGRIQVFK